MEYLSRIHIFVEVAKQQSFAGAARTLGLTGPAVSKQVQALEAKLGIKLLYRTTRRVSMTEEGAIYFERARKAIEDLIEAEQQIEEMKECPTGKLKVNAPLSFGNQYLVEPIAQFARQYPDVELEIDFDDRWVDVVGEGFDVVIRIGVLDDSSLVARRLAACPIFLCASPMLVEKHGLPETVSQLADFPALTYNRHQRYEEWQFEDQQGNRGVEKLRSVFSANTAEMQLRACLDGLGVALLPVFACNTYLASGDLVHLLPSFKTSPERGIYAMFPQNRHLSTRVRLFVDHLSEVGKGLTW